MGVHHRYSHRLDNVFGDAAQLKSAISECLVECLVACVLALSASAAWSVGSLTHFSIASQNLADALDRFGEQSGLQVIYDAKLAGEHRSTASITGDMTPADALHRLLSGSGLQWNFVNDRTVIVRQPSSNASSDDRPGNHTERSSQIPMVTLGVIKVNEDPRRVLPNEASEAVFGFSKKVLETPRSISVISQEQVDLLRLSAVEDLVRLVPGVFTTTRYGIQGAVDIRNVPADTYFRGMKRLTLQGHGRSVLAATDTIEIVRGPPSPIDGMGKVGGFTNVVPKSGRARLGGYLDAKQGFLQVAVGAYNQKEFSAGLGGPIQVFGEQGGYYNYALLEDSGSYTRNVPVKQKLLQTAVSIDNFIGPFRVETGANYQLSKTSGALLNRVTQDLVDNGRYIRGDPLAMLDANANGSIGYLEYSSASPVRGNLSSANQPLAQRWAWPRDANGRPLSIADFPKVAGIPRSLYDYLIAACDEGPSACPDPTGLLRAQGAGGPLPISGYVPIGFALDPRTVGYEAIDLRRAGAYERDITAEFATGYFDLVFDANPEFTIKNQLFIDSMDQYKVSNQPSGGDQDVLVLADKLTMTRRWTPAQAWLKVNTLGSLIFRNTHSGGRRYGGDFGTNRTDVMNGQGRMTPNTTFIHSYENSDLYNDGMPWTSNYDTDFWEAGAGLLFDIDLFEKTNVMVGGRFDLSKARNVDAAGIFDPTVGNAARPGIFTPSANIAEGWDHGGSWSLSVSHEVLPHVRPYVTISHASIALDRNNNSLTNDVIRHGHIGTARLLELGAKASLFDEKLFVSSAIYEQSRIDGSPDDPAALLDTEVTQTLARGWETEVKWVPCENLFVSAYALAQKTTFSFAKGANIMIDARALGFEDVVDANGSVIYPAEAFLYGGRAFISLPDGLEEYKEKQGNPSLQVGLNTTYKFPSGVGFTLSGNYFSSVYSGRLKLIDLPEAKILDAGLFWENAEWRVKLDVSNLFNERYFRGRTGDTFADMLIQAMPTRRWQLTANYIF